MNLRKFRLASLAALLSLQALPTYATVYQGTVTNVTAAFGTIYVFINNGSFGGSQGSCPTGTGMVFSIPASPSASDFGKAMVSIALTARVTGQLVYAAGDGICTNGNPYNGTGSEGLAYLDLKG